jgi:ATPase family associated with various cellular activities (AAA)
MDWLLPLLTYTLAVAVGVLGGVLLARWHRRRRQKISGNSPVADLIRTHFRPAPLRDLTISERKFPHRVRADLQRALDRLLVSGPKVCHFCGVSKEYAYEGLTFTGLLVEDYRPAVSVPPQFEDVDVGEDEPVRCLQNGLWLLQDGDCRYAVLLAASIRHGEATGLQFHVATVNNPEGTRLTQRLFKHLEQEVNQSGSYRGKVLSLEQRESYSGQSAGITVHRLRTVERDQVILPRSTLDLLERNVIQFVTRRSRLSAFGLSTKKGLLFYGPPGTGKTHTIHYLARALEGHTTLLISAEQVGLLDEYMALARLLQPSIVVIEDVDLIARERTTMGTCEEVMLNKLLNEMDGLREDADILFILTTNRPEALEAALASRPGRIDQAIEFPLPDEEGRDKLVRLYARGVEVPEDVVEAIVKRTERVSAAFIKELMRRSMQFHLERTESGRISLEDVDQALQEMLMTGGSLNLKLLGGSGGEFGFMRGKSEE